MDKRKKDSNLISVGFRIPKYLSDFIKSYEDEEKGIKKSDVFRMFLDILYDNPWIIAEYLDKGVVNSDVISELDNKVNKTLNKLNDLENKYEMHNKMIVEGLKSANNRIEFMAAIIEKLLGVSLAQIQNAPDHVLENIYSQYLEKRDI